MSSILSTVASAVHSVAGRYFDGKLRKSAFACLDYVKEHATHGDAVTVIAAMDEFAAKNMMMNVGENKGAIVDELIRSKKPRVMVELGAYTGYSAVRFANLQREVAGPNSHYYSFEFSAEFAEIAKEIVAFAGLSDQVTVITGAFAEHYKSIPEAVVDTFFIDHEKSCYLPDAKLIIDSGLLRRGSLLIADNVLFPGTPEYLDFVQHHPELHTDLHEAPLAGRVSIKDAVAVTEYRGE